MQPLTSHEHSNKTRAQLAGNITHLQDIRQTDTSLKSAAVAMTIFNHNGEASIIVTRRSSRLKEHKGQWALPGGRVDPGETSIEAALRELDEEVQLSIQPDGVLGLLDDYVTRSGYIITPVVLWADTSLDELTGNPDEVESIHAFTFTELMREDSPNLETIPESDRQVLSMNYEDDVMYAPTAAMLYQFREVGICGRQTRVIDYDQPVFAWR